VDSLPKNERSSTVVPILELAIAGGTGGLISV